MTIRVALVCSGLGHVRRGYETFMQEMFEALRRERMLDLWLFKGSGERTEREIPLPNLARAGFGARLAGELTGRGPYVVEQATLSASLLPHLSRIRPQVVYYCDPTIGRVLWHWRGLTDAPYRLLLHNGGPHPPPHRWCDHVQQLTPAAMVEAVAAGQSPARQTLLPCGVHIGPEPRPLSLSERASLRRDLALPADRPVVLSVGALNRAHKRMDYLITEVAALADLRPYLVMLGEPEQETPAVRAMAEALLGRDGFAMRTVRREEVDGYYRAADVFGLASLQEAFGLAYVEALAHGLPSVAHDQGVTRFVLGEQGLLTDLRRPGFLADALRTALSEDNGVAHRVRRHRWVRDRFGWDALLPEYVAMLTRLAAAAAPVRARRLEPAAGVGG